MRLTEPVPDDSLPMVFRIEHPKDQHSGAYWEYTNWPEEELEEKIRHEWDRRLSIRFLKSDVGFGGAIVNEYVLLFHWDSGSYESGIPPGQYGDDNGEVVLPHVEAIDVGRVVLRSLDKNGGYSWAATGPKFRDVRSKVHEYVGEVTLDRTWSRLP